MLFPLLARQGCGRCGAGVPVWSDVCQGCGHVLHSPGTAGNQIGGSSLMLTAQVKLHRVIEAPLPGGAE